MLGDGLFGRVTGGPGLGHFVAVFARLDLWGRIVLFACRSTVSSVLHFGDGVSMDRQARYKICSETVGKAYQIPFTA